MVRKLSVSLVAAVIVPLVAWFLEGLSTPLSLFILAALGFGVSYISAVLASEDVPDERASGTEVEADVEDGRERGVVKWFNVKKGFGFITWDAGEDVFVHFRSIRGQGHRSLAEGQRVKFTVVQGDKGPQAEDVTAVR